MISHDFYCILDDQSTWSDTVLEKSQHFKCSMYTFLYFILSFFDTKKCLKCYIKVLISISLISSTCYDIHLFLSQYQYKFFYNCTKKALHLLFWKEFINLNEKESFLLYPFCVFNRILLEILKKSMLLKL